MKKQFGETAAAIQYRPSNAARRRLAFALPWALAGVMVAGAAPADDHDRDAGPVRLLTTIPIPGPSPMKTFDISWVDSHTHRYYLADRTNKAIDVIDTQTNAFIEQIKASPPFAGASGNNDTSGPNGVVTAGKWLFATDYPSRVVSIDLGTNQTKGDLSTGGVNRADELAWDPEHGNLLVVNNADDPPFATLVHVDSNNGSLTLVKRITFDAASGVNATNGAEQPVWDRGTGKFYISIPQTGANAEDGAVARINPTSGAIEKIFPVKLCQPAGLTLGANQDLLVGCSVAFDTLGKPWSLANPLTKPTATTAAPISVIMDARTGEIDANVKGVSGNDEVWFNPGDGRYYLAARAQPGGPVLGVIDARSKKLIQLVPTVNQATVPSASPQPGSAHSVAVDSSNNHVFVPLPTNNVFPNCLNGCVAVFEAPRQRHGERDDD